MDVTMTVRNFRRFADSQPAIIELRSGITGLLGPNNAGKSSLLRMFYELHDIFVKLSQPSSRVIESLRTQTKYNAASTIHDQLELFSDTNSRDLSLIFDFPSLPFTDVLEAVIPERVSITIPRASPQLFSLALYANNEQIIPSNLLDDWRDEVLYSRSNNESPVFLSHVLALFRDLSSALYLGPFRNIITSGSVSDYFDISVGEAFVHSWRDYKTGPTKIHQQAALRVEEDVRRIFGLNTFDINASNDSKTLQFQIDNRVYKHTETGTGLAQFVIALANASIKSPHMILIDEPEMSLHPRLQLDFLTTLASYSTSGTLFFATHSVGLARSASDRIYTIRPVNDTESSISDYEATSNLSEFLGELSFSGWQDVGFDKVLLVEGATEVKTIQQFLRMLSKEHRILLVSLGGRQMIRGDIDHELRELLRITPDIVALIDSERDEAGAILAPELQAFAEVCDATGIDCHILDRRATENYLADRAIKIVKGENFRALEPFEQLKSVSPAWPKRDNWRIARQMTREELLATDLGKFLETL